MIQWIKEGEGNSHYFHQVIKERVVRNNISKLMDDQGQWVEDQGQVEELIMKFSKQLLGYCAQSLQGVDHSIMRRGNSLSREQCLRLIRPITTIDIDQGLHNIHSSNAPGIDGYNSFFYKKIWHIIKKDVYEACLLFFKHGKFVKSLNCTLISLVPKVANPSNVK